MSKVRFSQEQIDERVKAQREWMDEVGGDLSGYVKRYGSASDPIHHGDGGEAIFMADYNHLLAVMAGYPHYKGQS